MDERNERLRSARDGSDISLMQAQLWMDLGAALAGILRRMRKADTPSAEKGSDGTTTDGQAGQGGPSDREAA